MHSGVKNYEFIWIILYYGEYLTKIKIISVTVLYNSTYPEAGFRITSYPDRLGSSSKFAVNSTKLTCLEITGYWIKYSTVFPVQWVPGLSRG